MGRAARTSMGTRRRDLTRPRGYLSSVPTISPRFARPSVLRTPVMRPTSERRSLASYFAFAVLAAALITLSPASKTAHELYPALPATEDKPQVEYMLGSAERSSDLLAKLPARFEPNVGQAGDGVAYTLKTRRYVAALTSGAIRFGLSAGRKAEDAGPDDGSAVPETTESKGATISMSFIGANPSPSIEEAEPQEGISNYLLGDDPAKWRTNVAGYSKVYYRDLWPGIDMVIYNENGQARYDFVVAPGADPDRIAFRFEGAEGASISGEGDLVAATPFGDLINKAPFTYQGEEKTAVESRFTIDDEGAASFELGEFDHSMPLVIDPSIAYSTYLGGSSGDYGRSVAVNSSGEAYTSGYTNSTNFLTNYAYQVANAGSSDLFVTKINAAGTSALYSTYLGGTAAEVGGFVAVDSTGAAYVTGQTSSTNYPTASPFQAASAGSNEGVISKLNPAGSALVYSSYLGGSGADIPSAIAVTSDGYVCVTGQTASTNFPTTSPYQAANAGLNDGFVTKINIAGSAKVFSTYLGGTGQDYPNAIALDVADSAYVTGQTDSTNFPTATPYQGDQGSADAFVTKISATGTTLFYSTYLGGSLGDIGTGIAVDSSGNAYVSGNTVSTNFPVLSAFQPASAGSTDGFVTKLSNNGTAPLYSTYLGGSGVDTARSIAVDTAGAAHVVGYSNSTNYPTASPIQATNLGVGDLVASKLAPSGSSLSYSSYLGSTGFEGTAPAVAIDVEGNMYVAGESGGTNYPTTGIQPSSAGSTDAVLTKISPYASKTYLAEGSTLGGFQTWVLIANPSQSTTAAVQVNFYTSTGIVAGPALSIPPLSRRSINANSYVGDWNVSTEVLGLNIPVYAERSMYSSVAGKEGSHLGKGVNAPKSGWYLPEGSSGPGFETWILVANPHKSKTANVTVTYMTGSGEVAGPNLTLLPQTRQSVRVNDWVTTYDVSTFVQATGTEVVAERSTYLSTATYKGATVSPGTPITSTSWVLGEGSTGPGFDTWILLANPNPNSITVRVTFLTSSGPVTIPEDVVISQKSRKSIKANDYVTDWNVSTKASVIGAGGGVVVERAVYTKDGSAYGRTAATGEGVFDVPKWILPEGASAGGFDTWVLVTNSGVAGPATATLTFLTDAGSVPGPVLNVTPGTRQAVKVNDFVSSYDVATLVEATGNNVVADHAIYAPPGPYRDANAGPGIPLT